MADNDYTAQVKRLGIPDKFIEHGEPNELYEECGFSVDQIYTEIIDLLKDKKKSMAG